MHSGPNGLAWVFVPLVLCACWQPTAFGTDTQDERLNAQGVAQLAARTSIQPRF